MEGQIAKNTWSYSLNYQREVCSAAALFPAGKLKHKIKTGITLNDRLLDGDQSGAACGKAFAFPFAYWKLPLFSNEWSFNGS